jgi:hypothetical protein
VRKYKPRRKGLELSYQCLHLYVLWRSWIHNLKEHIPQEFQQRSL